jgi:hypothetical protein
VLVLAALGRTEHAPQQRLEFRQRQRAGLRIERRVVVAFAELGRAVEVFVTTELLAQVGVQSDVVEKGSSPGRFRGDAPSTGWPR